MLWLETDVHVVVWYCCSTQVRRRCLAFLMCWVLVNCNRCFSQLEVSSGSGCKRCVPMGGSSLHD
eukprot:9005884-Alexandrium_andersonii.AAC.1